MESLDEPCGTETSTTFTAGWVLSRLPRRTIDAPFLYQRMRPAGQYPESRPDTNIHIRALSIAATRSAACPPSTRKTSTSTSSSNGAPTAVGPVRGPSGRPRRAPHRRSESRSGRSSSFLASPPWRRRPSRWGRRDRTERGSRTTHRLRASIRRRSRSRRFPRAWGRASARTAHKSDPESAAKRGPVTVRATRRPPESSAAVARSERCAPARSRATRWPGPARPCPPGAR